MLIYAIKIGIESLKKKKNENNMLDPIYNSIVEEANTNKEFIDWDSIDSDN